MGAEGDKIVGRGKEALGALKGDDELKREGKRDQAAGDAKEKIRDAGDWAEDKVDDVKDRLAR